MEPISTLNLQNAAAFINHNLGGCERRRLVRPNNYDQTVSFSQEEFEDALKSGGLAVIAKRWQPFTQV
jgi:hypothetical protein